MCPNTEKNDVILVNYLAMLVQVPITQRPALCIQYAAWRHGCTQNIERHRMMSVRVGVIPWISPVMGAERHAGKGVEVGWVISLPLYRHPM